MQVSHATGSADNSQSVEDKDVAKKMLSRLINKLSQLWSMQF